MNLALNGKVILVTGASKGIGRAIAEAFAAEGSKVALNARVSQDLEDVVASLQRIGAEALAAPADVTNLQAVNEMVERIAARFGTIDVLVNNAGGIGAFASFEELADADWRIGRACSTSMYSPWFVSPARCCHI